MQMFVQANCNYGVKGSIIFLESVLSLYSLGTIFTCYDSELHCEVKDDDT
jgi:hypothetical protein